jgi:hypothetical protein
MWNILGRALWNILKPSELNAGEEETIRHEREAAEQHYHDHANYYDFYQHEHGHQQGDTAWGTPDYSGGGGSSGAE